MAEKGNQSDFLTTMSRDESDVLVVQKCCVVIGNIVASGNCYFAFFRKICSQCYGIQYSA